MNKYSFPTMKGSEVAACEHFGVDEEGNHVEVRVLHKEHMEPTQIIAMRKEARVLQRLGRLDSFLASERAYYVVSRVEHVGGSTLQALIDTESNPTAAQASPSASSLISCTSSFTFEEPPCATRSFTRSFLTSLKSLHSEGVCHNRLTPKTVVVSTDGAVSFRDFSSARGRWEDAHHVKHTHFTAPELLSGVSTGADGEKCDVWSAGLLVYYMSTGVLPFYEGASPRNGAGQRYSALTSAELLQNIKEMTLEGVQLGAECRQLLTRMLEVNPAERATMEEVLSHTYLTPSTVPALAEEEDSAEECLTEGGCSGSYNEDDVEAAEGFSSSYDSAASVPSVEIATLDRYLVETKGVEAVEDEEEETGMIPVGLGYQG